MDDSILEMKSIVKEFPGVRALDDVTFNVKRGEIHALVGENGAGKSTLMKVLSGVYPYGTYEGDIIINGEIQRFDCIRNSEDKGVSIIYQELALVKQMNIAENISLGYEIAQKGIINWDETFLRAEACLKKVGLTAPPTTLVNNLGVGEQQMVEIAKALSKNASILILDEPTAALAEEETATLLNLLRVLQKQGVTCIYISHRLKEVFEIADRITVLRDGKTVATHNKSDLDEGKLIALMVGRSMQNVYPPRPDRAVGDVVMEVKDWTVFDPAINKTIDNVSFCVRRGEVLGIAGLVGAGRTELVMSLFGIWGRRVNGQVILEGNPLTLNSASDAIKSGISLASEDRKKYGLVLKQSVMSNISLASLEKISKNHIVNENEEINAGEKYTKELNIKTPTIEQLCGNLSGGNQQKVVLGKWLMTQPKVLILDEPTRGIDVGAKYEIYNIIHTLVDQGVGVIVISSELPEILGISDRILVMHDGIFTGELMVKDATQEKIMYHATGGR
ncbi:MAG: xylose ABC transporter ATP-binding protein [Spartobacteria bacterium]|nr:xylose ABC transporter ATP-binding protein [Spartobacteria bacterium]